MNSRMTKLTLTAIIFCCNSLFSANTQWLWNGGTSGDWFTKTNWTTTDSDPGVGSDDTVIINNGNARYPTLVGNTQLKKLTMNGGWLFSNGYDFNTTNDITIHSGNFYTDGSKVSATNLYLNGGVMVLNGDKINVSNDVVINGGYLFILSNDVVIPDDLFLISGTLDLNGKKLSVADEYTRQGGGLLNAGTLSISKLILDFTGTDIINYTINISSSVKFINGIIQNSSSSLMIFDHDAKVEGADDASHVNGPVRRLVTSKKNGKFKFPVGNGSLYAPIEISDFNQARSEDYFTAQYFNGSSPYDHNALDATLDHISDNEYWILNREATSGTPQTDAYVRLSFDETNRSENVELASQLRVARWDGTSWKDHGYTSKTGNDKAGTFRSSSVITDFGPFTVGTAAGNGGGFVTNLPNGVELTAAVSLFPNPAIQTVNVILSEPVNEASIMVFNSLGMKVMELNQQSGTKFVLDMTELENGMYTIEVHHKDGVYISKILKLGSD